MLKRKDTRLLIIGKKDYFMRRLERSITERRHPSLGDVLFVSEVGDQELVGFYKGARAVAVVSCEEGFGLPGIEALQYGTSVIASDRSSLPEVYRNHAYYVNPYDVQDMARVLGEVLHAPHPNPLLKGEGSSFSSQPAPTVASGEKVGMRLDDEWEKLAQATKAVYESVA